MLVLHVMRSIYIDKEKFYKKRDVLENLAKMATTCVNMFY